MALPAIPVTMNELKHENSRSPTPLPFPECRSSPQNSKLSDYTETKSAECGLFTLHIFMASEALPGLFCAPFAAEAGGDRRDSTFVWSTHQSHLLQVHMWGYVLPLEHFTIYQLNRQMLNPFLHLLNLCRFRQAANTTHRSLSTQEHQNMPFPNSLVRSCSKEGGRKEKVVR